METGKKFRDTAVGKFLADAAPEALKILGDSKIPLVSQIASAVGSAANLSVVQKQQFNSLLADYEKDLISYSTDEEDERTSRLKIDMTSDSWLSKNIRPLILIAAFILFTILTFLNSVSWGLKTPDIYMNILQELLLMAVSFYFVDRTINKAILNNKK